MTPELRSGIELDDTLNLSGNMCWSGFMLDFYARCYFVLTVAGKKWLIKTWLYQKVKSHSFKGFFSFFLHVCVYFLSKEVSFNPICDQIQSWIFLPLSSRLNWHSHRSQLRKWESSYLACMYPHPREVISLCFPMIWQLLLPDSVWSPGWAHRNSGTPSRPHCILRQLRLSLSS